MKKLIYLFPVFLITSCWLHKFTEVSVTDGLSGDAAVFAVLDKKCNSCHNSTQQEKNPPIFTKKNMGEWKKDIDEILFDNGHLPKGENKLTTNELDFLKSWLKG